MIARSTGYKGLIVFDPTILKDERGSFHESYRDYVLNHAVGEEVKFVQENQSVSHKDIFRGFHFQFGEMAQAKLVKVVRGSAIDIVIDLRKNEPTYGRAYSEFLSADEGTQMFIPVGFAHGFLSMEDDTIFQYKCTNYYSKAHEGGINPVPYVPDFYKINDRDKSFPDMKTYLDFYEGKVTF